MDLNPLAQVCRLCLESSDDTVNVFDKFQNSTIASILTKYFWFQVHKNDGLSEWLCQICWIQTKTFHHFYKRIEFRHRNESKSNVMVRSDEIKQERSVTPQTLEADLTLVKREFEEAELTLTCEAIDSQTCQEGSSFDCNDDQSNFLSQYELFGENSQTSDDETVKIDGDDDSSYAENQTPGPDIKLKTYKSLSLSEQEEENVQMREFFNMKCEICTDVEFETFVAAKKHYRKVHNTRGYLMCCGKKIWRRYLIMQHIRRHINPDGFRCDQCGKSLINKYALKKHIAIHAPVDSRAYKCSLCSSSYTIAGALKRHMQDKHSGEKFPCDKCDKNFRSKFLLTSHMRQVHIFSLEHVCEICARRFKTKSMLRSHIIYEHSTQPKVQCDICGVWLKHKLSLRCHMKRVHQEDDSSKPVKCTICNKMLAKKALSSHIRYAHGERRHQCKLCDKAFKCAINLKEHVALHTGEYLYNCPYCEKKFKSNANQCSHRKKAHLVEWTRDSRVALKKNSTDKANK